MGGSLSCLNTSSPPLLSVPTLELARRRRKRIRRRRALQQQRGPAREDDINAISTPEPNMHSCIVLRMAYCKAMWKVTLVKMSSAVKLLTSLLAMLQYSCSIAEAALLSFLPFRIPILMIATIGRITAIQTRPYSHPSSFFLS